ncbi:MAG TPA: hypothetical protein PJ982_02615, partial [Lacipirellulaceae bacterium]|nr:hypothetical protein [Lacipirellulaceae bacterium]
MGSRFGGANPGFSKESPPQFIDPFRSGRGNLFADPTEPVGQRAAFHANGSGDLGNARLIPRITREVERFADSRVRIGESASRVDNPRGPLAPLIIFAARPVVIAVLTGRVAAIGRRILIDGVPRVVVAVFVFDHALMLVKVFASVLK